MISLTQYIRDTQGRIHTYLASTEDMSIKVMIMKWADTLYMLQRAQLLLMHIRNHTNDENLVRAITEYLHDDLPVS